MKVDFIWISNYKSLKGRKKLTIDSEITAVIGKNESGKSNLIDILGSISLINGLPKDVYSQTPQEDDNAKLVIEIECSLTETEIKTLNLNKKNKKTTFKISQIKGNSIVSFDGGVKDYFSEDNFQYNLKVINDYYEKYKNNIENTNVRNNILKYINQLKRCNTQTVPDYSSYLDYIKRSIEKILSNEEKELFITKCNETVEYFNNLYKILPVFYKYSENSILGRYSVNSDFLEKDSSQLQSIKKLLKIAGCGLQDLREACIDYHSSGRGIMAKNKIIEGISNNIEVGFNGFYKQEPVRIHVDIGKGHFSIFIQSNKGPILSITERSQGLKWYFNMYIDMIDKNISGNNVVYLIDEPGVHLHVDAQKSLLSLLKDLSSKNQIIYTTHSPFMLNQNRLDRIRVLLKNENGNTDIITSVLSLEIPGSSKSEALSPLVNALGMKLYQNIGMSEYSLNVITEGYFDAVYLDAMGRLLQIPQIKFIPSIGAINSVYLANILWGWGLKFKVLFDWDKAGREGRKRVLKSYGYDNITLEAEEFKEKTIVMISDIFTGVSEAEIYTIESLITEEDYKKVGLNYSKEKILNDDRLKKVFCTRFAQLVNMGEISLSKETIQNFKRLFNLLAMDSKDNSEYETRQIIETRIGSLKQDNIQSKS